MKPDEIDRILAEDAPIEPSPGFAHAVMRRVRHAAAEPAPLAFPWRRALPGLAVCGAGIAVAFVAALRAVADDTLDLTPAVTASVGLIATPAIAWSAGALLGSYLVVKASLRFAGFRG